MANVTRNSENNEWDVNITPGENVKLETAKRYIDGDINIKTEEYNGKNLIINGDFRTYDVSLAETWKQKYNTCDYDINSNGLIIDSASTEEDYGYLELESVIFINSSLIKDNDFFTLSVSYSLGEENHLFTQNLQGESSIREVFDILSYTTSNSLESRFLLTFDPASYHGLKAHLIIGNAFSHLGNVLTVHYIKLERGKEATDNFSNSFEQNVLYKNAEYDNLNTQNKTVIGAINEIQQTEQGKTLGNLQFVRNGKNVQVYGDLTGLVSTQTTVQLGTIDFQSKLAYAIIPCFNKTLPYGPMSNASIWISGTGVVTLYKASGVTTAYVSGTYMCK